MWTPDPISLEVIKKLTGLFLDVAWKKSGETITKQLEQRIGTAVEEYVRTYEKRHCTLKYDCLRMDNPTNLEEIYTDVQVLDTRESRRFESPEALKELFLEIGRGFAFEKTTRQNGVAVANLQPRLMVLGSPGIGKSTFLRKVGLEALKWERATYRHEVIPVFLELKRFNVSQTQIEKFIAQEFEACGFPNAETLTQKLLKAGKLLVLLDGLDEVPTDQVDRTIEQIGDLVDRYDQNRFIASCRIAAYKGGFPRFKNMTMANFNDLQMETFVQKWFRREPRIGEQCWTLLNSEDYKAAKELGQTPLLLTLLCAVYDESQNFPKRRAALYGEALDVWLKKWASEKRIAHDPIYRELSLELEKILLSEIAYDNFSEDQLFFSKQEITEQIREFLMSNLNAPKHLDAEAVLKAIEVQQGILVERARDTYSFSHLTFQEYLTAQYIVDERQLEILVTQHLVDRRWSQVFYLAAGLMRNADDLLKLMEHQVKGLLNTEKLKALVEWAEKETVNSKGNYKPAAKRAGVLYLITHRSPANYLVDALDSTLFTDLNLDTAYANDGISNLWVSLSFGDPTLINYGSLEERNELLPIVMNNIIKRLYYLINSLRRITMDVEESEIFNDVDFASLDEHLEALMPQVPLQGATYESCRAFADQVLHILYSALHLEPEWTNLSEAEIESLQNYFRANRCMIRCKEAAVRVSPQVWEGIESRMLTVRDN